MMTCSLNNIFPAKPFIYPSLYEGFDYRCFEALCFAIGLVLDFQRNCNARKLPVIALCILIRMIPKDIARIIEKHFFRKNFDRKKVFKQIK